MTFQFLPGGALARLLSELGDYYFLLLGVVVGAYALVKALAVWEWRSDRKAIMTAIIIVMPLFSLVAFYMMGQFRGWLFSIGYVLGVAVFAAFHRIVLHLDAHYQGMTNRA